MPASLEEWDVTLLGGVCAISRKFPEVAMSVRPLGFRWAVRCDGPAHMLSDLENVAIPRSSLAAIRDRSNSALLFTYSPLTRESSLLRRIATPDGFVLPPMTLQGGTMRIRLLEATRGAPRDGPRLPLGARLVSRRSLTPARLREELECQAPGLPTLTSRQSEVLLAAVRAGYYEVPRKSTVEEIARQLSLGRSTTEEHLRIAESAVVRSTAPLVELARYDASIAGRQPPLEHYVRFSSELDLFVDVALRGEKIAAVQLLKSQPTGEVHPAHPFLTRILEHLRTGRGDFRDVPVDLAVGPFEQKVLDELRRIPTGETRTYAEVARRVGHPGASRAVGNACAHNPVPVVIPCHRVVPSRGGIGSYSAGGGPETKQRLLANEGVKFGPSEGSKGTPGSRPASDRSVSRPSVRPLRKVAGRREGR